MVKGKTSKSQDGCGKAGGENGKLALAGPGGKAAGFCRGPSPVFYHCGAIASLCLGQTALHAGNLVRNLETGASCVTTLLLYDKAH